MLDRLFKITTKRQKRLGRGIGSGVGGHTVGRGTKGHNARQGKSTPLWFEGGQLPLIKRLPYLRGKAHFQSITTKPLAIRLSMLGKLTGHDVTPETLVAAKIIKTIHVSVKIVGGGIVPKLKEVRGVQLTASVRRALESAGVKVIK